MPFDGNYESELSDELISDTNPKAVPLLQRYRNVALAVVVGAIAGGAVVYLSGPRVIEFAPVKAAAIPQPVSPSGQCDLREIPLGISETDLKHLCGEPISAGVTSDQLIYSGGYAYIHDGKFDNWQWGRGAQEDSFHSMNVAMIIHAPGSLAGAPDKAMWHKTEDIYLDSSGKEVSRSSGTHLVNVEFCHPGWRP